MFIPAVRKLGGPLIGLLTSFLVAQAASATVQISSAVLDAPGGRSGTISYAPQKFSEDGGIGRIRLTGTYSNTGAAVSYASYCVDIFDYLAPGTFSTASVAKLDLDATRLSRINAIITNSDPLIATADQSAAAQLAIWEIAYETGPALDVASGDFSVSGGDSAAAVTLADSWLDKVTNGTWQADPAMSLALLAAPGNQTQLLHGTDARALQVNDVAAVPEPASWAMMVVGFGALGGALRRRPARTLTVEQIGA